MILAGIDEAGYGPLLGPLVVGCAAFEVPGESPKEGSECLPLPCIWKQLKKVISRNRSKTGRKLHVNDSKMVYSPALGLKELERSVLAMAAAANGWEPTLEGFLSHVAPGLREEMLACPWYRPFEAEAFPIAQEGIGIKLFSNALRKEMADCDTHCLHLAGRVLIERKLNQMFDQTRNKSSTLFSIAAMHLDYLLRNFGDKGLVIFCDRQGGRGHYGHLMRLMFEEWSVDVLRESDGRSEYKMTRGEHVVWLTFCEKAEAQCLPVAMASMLCKYLREALMNRFNAYWKAMLPDIRPTAGYYGDGERFIREIDPKRREMGIADHELIRSR